ncbi:MAG: DUF2877 domain-containing protein [Nitrospinaceae bacterium]|nr:DUF2877 domain-containing protein [Nitrospinaceae bacterium]MBT4092843.1 DUF2877 domain-containing protein [Nitrospinaceae bacterium]MBT5368759.1 DUF2877 domain-containing protein [Nitrospinaceae bacterium]MBT5946331.1 DUF2877 domain-containing protein [Nitrospinaceae bacterium]MBT6394491.1 DUF2877 domain-containing protein [Nitrospinaceae bacterium]
MSGLCVIAGRFSFYFEGVDIWRPCDLPGGIKQADVRKGLDLLAAMAGERAPAEGLGRLIPEMAGAARGVEGVVDVGVERGAAKSENVGDMSGPEAPEGACQTANAAKRQVIRAGRAGAGALARWMCDMLHPKPQGPTQPGLRIEISSPGQRAAGLIGLGPGLTPSGDDFIGGAMVALRMLGRGVIADRLAEWALPLAAGTSRISRAHLAEAARGAGAGALHEMIEAVSRSVEGDISSSLGAINAIGHTSGWDALAGAVMALEAVFRNELGRDGFATNFHIGDNL